MKTFTFWKHNLKTNEYTLTLDELKNQYRAFLEGKELSWIEYYGHQTVAAFISESLQSVTDKKVIDFLIDPLMDVRHELLQIKS